MKAGGGILGRAWRAALLIALLGWLVLPAGIVQAHAELIGSNPASGQVVAQSPTTIELDFSEAVDANSARASLLNASGEVVATGTIVISPTSKSTLFVAVPAQPDGVYSLSWSVISADDGHDTSGTLAFSVGASSPKASLLPPPGAPDPATGLPSAGEMIFRGLAYMTTAMALGAAVFGMLVWRPAYREVAGRPALTGEAAAPLAAAPAIQAWDERVTGLLKALILFGSIGVILSMAAVLIWQSVTIDYSDNTPVWQTLLSQFGHHEGGYVWIRLLALPMMAVLSTLLPRAGSGPARPWWEIVAFGLITEWTYSLSGHSVALGSPLPIVGDWLHFTAMSFWLGGLVPLGIILLHPRFQVMAAAGAPPVDDMPSESSPAVSLLDCTGQRFSRLALISVIVLGLTGIYSALLQVRTLPALIGTTYGQAILIKSALFAVLIGLGALNQVRILPRIARVGVRALRRLGRSVRVEVALGALVLLIAGGLVSLAPGYTALQADQRTGLHETWRGDGVSMTFRVAPVQVGDNEFGVDITDTRPGADKAEGTALLRIQASDESTGQTQVAAKLTGDHRYTARGSYLSKTGAWDVLVIWRKSGFDDVTHTFTIDLAKWAAQTGQKVNPVPPSPASIDDGHTLYLTNCASCHGLTGKGDGPAGRALNPAPADLTQRAVPGVKTDGQLFDWITNGFPGSAMPAFRDQLTDQQRWDLVNFMRTLAK